MAKSQRKYSINYSNYWYLLILSLYETTYSSVIKDQDFSFVFFCIPRPEDMGCSLLESCTGKASKWLLKPKNTVPYMPQESLPVDPTPPRWTRTITAGFLWFHSQHPPNHKLSNTIKKRKCHQISFCLISQQRFLAAMQPVFSGWQGYLWKARFLLATTKDGGYPGSCK